MASDTLAQVLNEILPDESYGNVERSNVISIKSAVEKTEFYKVSNHHEVYRVGASYLADYVDGIKSFAISSLGYQASQQRMILGLASYFENKKKMKIGIISDNLFLGAFKTVVQSSKVIEVSGGGKTPMILVHRFHEHFDFLDLNELIEQAKSPGVDFYDLLKEVMSLFDLVFWDVPELHKIETSRVQYFPIVKCFESLSIIVAKGYTRREEVTQIRNFFSGYGINLKGLLLDEPRSPRTEDKISMTKRPWWKIWSP